MSPNPRAAVRRRKRHKKDERGVALILVLGALTVLTVFLTELQDQTSSELSSAITERDTLRAEYAARSAINLSRLLIATEPTIRRSIAPLFMMMKKGPPQIPVWEFTDLVLGPFNDANGVAGFNSILQGDTTNAKNLGLSNGIRFEVKIVDEDSKINVNQAARGDTISLIRLGSQLIGLMAPQEYNPLFEQHDADGQFSDRQTICGALVDWADPDEQMFACDPRATGPTATGGEDNYYQMIGLDYRRKNAAFDSLEELRLVRGVGDDFWSTFVDPEPDDPHKRIMTVWGQGTINVNTANAQTLLAVVCANAPDAELCNDVNQMQQFLMLVTMFRGMTMGAPLFSSANDFVNTMQGGGMLGPFLFTGPASQQGKQGQQQQAAGGLLGGLGGMGGGMGLTAVAFKSASDVKKQVSTESKMFSIYADGVVPGNRRESRIRIHAVVDFRNAQELGGAMTALPGGQQPSGQTPPGNLGAGSGAANNQNPQAATPQAMLAALQSNPAGTIVYWRVE